jgi:hypothetical protein
MDSSQPGLQGGQAQTARGAFVLGRPTPRSVTGAGSDSVGQSTRGHSGEVRVWLTCAKLWLLREFTARKKRNGPER